MAEVLAGAAQRGDLTALLDALARSPEVEAAGAWARELRPGDVLDRFEVLRELGRGGFGAVYEALDRELGRRVALKTLRPGRARDEWADEQLRREAQAAASLSHPGIVTLYEACTCERGPYLVLELLRGETLEERLARGPMPPAEAAEIGVQASRALAHVHSKGLVHRDLKPGNVFLGEDGRVKLLDLGLAHLLGRRSSAGGTPAYVAPEQWRGEDVSGKADVFALGAVLFEMVSGTRPFEVREGRSAALDPGRAPALGAGAPRRMARLVARCLDKEPGERPTAAQVAEELLDIQRDRHRRRSQRKLVLLAASAVAAGMLIAALMVRSLWGVPEAGPDGRIAVAVADFANWTGEPEMDSLSGLLITSLEQSRRFTVLTRPRMLDLAREAGRANVERIDELVGRALVRKGGAQALLVAAIHRFGSVYAVELRALDARTDRYLFTVKEQASSKEAVPDLIDRVAAGAREALRESPEDVRRERVRLGDAVTSSLAAYERYFDGEQLALDGRAEEALKAFRKAVELDPTFALAHLAIAKVLDGVDQEQRDAALAQALRHVDRVPEKERLIIRAWDAGLRYRTEEALAFLGQVQSRWPEDPEAYALAARFLHWQRGDPERVVALYEKAAALDSSRYPSAIKAQIYAGRLEGALSIARRFAERRPGPLSLRYLLVVQSMSGDVASALETARSGLRSGNPLTDEILHALIRGGALDEAEERVRPALTTQTPEIERRDAFVRMAVLQAVRGRQREAVRTLDAAAREVDGGKPSTQLRWSRAFLLGGSRDVAAIRAAAAEQAREGLSWPICEAFVVADLGDLPGAEKLLRDASPELGKTPCARITRAVVLWRRGDLAGAIAELQAFEYGADRFYLGRMLLDAHREREAVAAFRSFANRTSGWLPFFAWSYPQSLYFTALAHERLGEREAARERLDLLLAIWKDAETDLPLLADARARRARLAAPR